MPDDEFWVDDEDDEFGDDEDPDDLDDDATATLSCPHCGAEIYEDAVRCPACENYVTPDTRVFSNRPLWWILLGLTGIVAVVLVLSGFLSC